MQQTFEQAIAKGAYATRPAKTRDLWWRSATDAATMGSLRTGGTCMTGR
jgi:hypothetical protein